MRETSARSDIFLSIQVALLISHLGFLKMVRNLILSHGLIEIMRFFVEKMKKENIIHFEKHVNSR